MITKKIKLRILVAIAMATIAICGSSRAKCRNEAYVIAKGTVDVSILGRTVNNQIVIEKDVDLRGAVCKLPKGKTLVIKKGTIRNGTLIGNNTQLVCKQDAFDKVTIQGTWDVPEISTKLFTDLGYENSLRDVVALAHPKVQNRIVIEKGVYKVKGEKNSDVCVPICSNTDLILKGTVKLVPNDYKSYNIIQAKGENISINGNGTIIGDKHTHIGTEGEWGMGINLRGAINTTVSGLTIKDCWGDCIYVGGNSQNVLIENCKLDHGRRQGVSVTKADGVTIRNCTITNVGGTAPEFAIDIEPNRRDSVNNILIENVTVKDCEGGFLATRGIPKDDATTPWIGNVTIRNCKVSCKSKLPIKIKRCEDVKIEKCAFYAQETITAISVTETGKAVVQNNIVSIGGSLLEKIKNDAKKLMGRDMKPIHVKKAGLKIVKNNKVVE